MLATLRRHFSVRDIQTLRFFFGVMFAIALAYGINWPFAFITPVFVAKFLAPNTPRIQVKGLMAILLIITFALLAGMLFTQWLLPFPIVFILLSSLALFWFAYWGNSGGNEFVITMLLIGLTLIPMLTFIHPVVVVQFVVGFLFSCVMSLMITMVINECFPRGTSERKQAQKAATPSHKVRVKLALLTTMMIMPVLIFFLFFQLTGAVLILVFVAIMAQKPDLVVGVKGAKAMLLGNAIGGIAAIIVYSLLVIAPTFTFAILIYACMTMIFARYIFSDNPLSPLFLMAMTTAIIIVSGASLGEADASEKFYLRILQIGGACAYIILATFIASPLIKKINEAEQV